MNVDIGYIMDLRFGYGYLILSVLAIDADMK